MPSGSVLAAFAVAGLVYLGSVAAVHGVQKLGCKLHLHQSKICQAPPAPQP